MTSTDAELLLKLLLYEYWDKLRSALQALAEYHDEHLCDHDLDHRELGYNDQTKRFYAIVEADRLPSSLDHRCFTSHYAQDIMAHYVGQPVEVYVEVLGRKFYFHIPVTGEMMRAVKVVKTAADAVPVR